jgi:hypothetical protein
MSVVRQTRLLHILVLDYEYRATADYTIPSLPKVILWVLRG